MTFEIESSFINQNDATRLYRDFPKLEKGPDNYCPTCGKFGTYFWKGQAHQCNCYSQLQLHKHYLVAGVGVTYQRLGWEDYEGPQEIVDAMEKYLVGHANFVSRGIGLLIAGPFGVGKTMLTTLLLKELIKKGYKCYSTTFAGLLDILTAGWKDPQEQRYFQEKFVNSDVLLLDDLGREFRAKNGLSEASFDNILRKRVQGGRPTFITTNMSLSELEEGYGSAVLSLMKEVSLEYEFNEDSEDFRSQSQKRTIQELQRGEVRPII